MNLFQSLNQFWGQRPIRKVNFEYIKTAIKNPPNYYIINTLPQNFQDCLISNTISYLEEEKIINEMISSYQSPQKTIIIYGMNSQDDTAENKYKQLCGLGLENVYLYSGGLFEWALLQDIYGTVQFPTSSKVIDIIRLSNNKKSM